MDAENAEGSAPPSTEPSKIIENATPIETTPLFESVKVNLTIVESVDANSAMHRHAYRWPEICQRLRNVAERPSKSACALLKLATFNGRRCDANVAEIHGIEADYDDEQVSPADAAARLTAAGVRALIYTSPSHRPDAPRWRVLAPLSKSYAPTERTRFVDLLNGALGGILATESWTLSQVFYFGRVAGSPYEFHEVDGTCIDELDLVLEPIGRSGASTDTPAALPLPSRTWTPDELQAAVADVRKRAADAGDEAFERLFRGDTSEYSSNHSQADLALATRAAGYCDRDPAVTDAVMRASGLMRAKWERGDYRARTLSKALAHAPDTGPASTDDFEVIEQAPIVAPAERPKLTFIGTRKGKHPATVANIATALRRPDFSGLRVAYDNFRGGVVVAPEGTADWRSLTDEGVTRIMELLERAGFRPMARETMRHSLSMVAKENEFDTAILWLNGLAWDGAPRVERFLVDYCHAEDNPYSQAVSLYWWTAHAGRVLEPGCKADSVPILVGIQGARKTTLAESLVPSLDHFVEVNLAERDADLSRKMRGRLLGEISELRGLGTRDLESVKAFITRRTEVWIPKYYEFDDKFERRLVFVGTTNDQEFLSDVTGNRRFLPVRVRDIDIAAIRRDRLQLWAEGAALWRASGIAWKGAEELAPAVHGQHMITDSWETLLDRWLDGSPDDLGGSGSRRDRPFTTAEVMTEALGLRVAEMNPTTQKRVVKLLRAAGFEQKITKIGNKSVRVWVRQ